MYIFTKRHANDALNVSVSENTRGLISTVQRPVTIINYTEKTCKY